MIPPYLLKTFAVIAVSMLPTAAFALTLPEAPGSVVRDLPEVPRLAAASPSSSRFSSLAELSAYALANRPDTRAAWLAMQVQAARLDAANAADFPTLTASFNFTQSQSLASSGNAVPVLNRYGPTLSLAYALYDFGVRDASQAAQRWRLLASAYSANRQLQDVVVEVETAYYALQAARSEVDAQTETTAALKASFDAAQARFNGGLATRADTLRAQAALAEAVLVLQTGERDVVKSDAALRHAAAIDQTQRLELAWDAAPPPVDAAPAVLDALITEAARLRPDLAALAAQAAAAREDANQADAARWPTLSLAANVGRTAFLEDDRVASTTYSVGVNVSVPLFDGGRLRAEARAAQREAEQFDAQLASQTNTVAREVAEARADTAHAQGQREGIATQFAAASESAKAAAARYRAGLGSLLELLTAEADLARARQARAQADADWLTAFSRLNHALGRAPVAAP